jgi:uncharacterized protein (TIGR03435 family)
MFERPPEITRLTRSAWARDASIDAGPSIFTAIQEQLGLRLESAKAPVEVFVIDRCAEFS